MKRVTVAAVTVSFVLGLGLTGGAAVGGGKAASHHLAKNSVKSKTIAPGAVQTSDLHNGAVTGAKVAPDSLTGAQIDESTLGTVPNASAISGITLVPVGGTLTSGGQTVLYNANGITVTQECNGGGFSRFTVSRAAGAPGAWISGSLGVVDPAAAVPPGSSIFRNQTNGKELVTIAGPGTALDVLDLSVITDASPLTCFARGTITRQH